MSWDANVRIVRSEIVRGQLSGYLCSSNVFFFFIVFGTSIASRGVALDSSSHRKWAFFGLLVFKWPIIIDLMWNVCKNMDKVTRFTPQEIMEFYIFGPWR